MPSERASVNQKIQIGAESTSSLGASVAAGKLLENYDFTIGVMADVKNYRPTGRKYDTVTEENIEWTEATLGGVMDYNSLIYPLAGVFGTASPANHSPSTTAKDWIFTPPVTGSVTPQTYTIQQGDAVRAHQFSYGLFTDFGYKVTRKDATCTGKLLGQLLTDGATLTSSPVAVSLAPIVGKAWNVYLDATSGGLGTTQLLKVLSFEFSASGMYGPFYALNRANTSYTGHVDLAPKTTVKLMLEADSNGMALLGYMQNNTTMFLRFDAQGATIDVPNTIKNEFIHDLAVRVTKPNPFKDDAGIFACEWELTVVEDSTWAKSQTVTCTNLITAL